MPNMVNWPTSCRMILPIWREVRATLNRMHADQELLRPFLCWTDLDHSPFFL